MQYAQAAKSHGTALLLTLFCGGIGGHRFYLGQVGSGILYLCFFWTFIPACIAFIELFLITKRVDRHNEDRARELAAQVMLLGPAVQV